MEPEPAPKAAGVVTDKETNLKIKVPAGLARVVPIHHVTQRVAQLKAQQTLPMLPAAP